MLDDTLPGYLFTGWGEAPGSICRKCSIERTPRARDEESGQGLRDKHVSWPWGQAGAGKSGREAVEMADFCLRRGKVLGNCMEHYCGVRRA